mgnify:CR=1 FL=1|tara:strand:+ start:658 stop:2922 length:2265 start_codon:yes stop_codon:yes gene_type:complete
MSDTLNRPMFKRGPDGQMRQAYWGGGISGMLKAVPTMYKAAKYKAPKFTNLPYNINRMMGRGHDIQPPFVGKTGPTAYSPVGNQSYDWRMKAWTDKYNTLKDKHGISGFQASGLMGKQKIPQEVLDHWQTMPKMPGKRVLAESIAYPVTAQMVSNWGNRPDDPHSNIKEEVGSMDQEEVTGGTGERPWKEDEIEGPKVPGTNVPDNSIAGGEDEVGDEYDGPSDRQPGLFGSGGMPDLTSEAAAMDESISLDGIDKYKNELRELIGKEDKTMGSLLLMQLGLGMMAGKSMQPGFAGFAEILGKTGQQVLPMFMQHMQNKRKEDKEIALAAYDMLREDRAAKTKRTADLADWVWKEQYKLDDWVSKEEYKNTMNPPGELSVVQRNTPITLASGEVIDNWKNVKQIFSKSPEALSIIAMGDPNVQVVPYDLSDAGMMAAGLGDMSLTNSQRGQESLLADTYKGNLGPILNFIMDPEIGVHSGNFHTGTAGRFAQVGRFVTRDIQHLFNTFFPESKTAARANAAVWGMLRSTTEDTMQSLVDSQMGLLAGEGNVATKRHGGQKDVQFGTYMDETGNMREGNYATEKYVRNLFNNNFYDVSEQMVNMMGFLEARLKQPTGRLLADTIKSSIDTLRNEKLMGGDPKQYANRLHHFVRRLYEAYARHSIKAGQRPETSFGAGRLGQELTIQGYNQSYLGFLGPEAVDRGIDLRWMDQLPSGQENIPAGNAPGNIYPGKQEVVINAPADFGELMKWAGGAQ